MLHGKTFEELTETVVLAEQKAKLYLVKSRAIEVEDDPSNETRAEDGYSFLLGIA